MHYSLARATTWNVIGYLYLIVASLIATPIILHGLGLEQFGKYSLILATTILVSSFDLGLPQAVVRALSREDRMEARRTLWATSSLLFMATGTLAGFIAVFLTSWLSASLIALILVFVMCLLNNVISHYQTLPQSEGRFGWYNAKTFVVGTGNTFLAAYLAWVGLNLEVILAAQVATYLITTIILAIFSLRYFPHPRNSQPSWKVAQELTSFGLKNQVGKIVGQIQAQYGKYLLSSVSALNLSAYVVAQGLVQKLAGGVVQVATALYPASAKGESETRLRSTYYLIQGGLLTAGIFGVVLYNIIGFPFLSWWLHEPELVSVVYEILKVLVWYFCALILTPLASTILDASGRPGVTSMYAGLTTTFEIVLALLLFSRHGLFAPVYAALVAVTITTPLLLMSADRMLRKRN